MREIFKDLFTRIILSFLLLLLTSLQAKAQTYFDVPVQLDYYRTTSDDLDFSRRGVIINPSVGIVVAGNDSSRFEAHVGIGIFFSKFNQDVGGSKFEFNALGPIQTSFTGYYNFNNRLQAGLGLCFGWFGVYEKGLNINTDPEYPDRLGDGYKSINLGNSVDIRYNVDSRLSLGAKYTYWYLPQLEYTKIGDYGEFEKPQKDLYITRLEFSIRVFVTDRNYNRK
ncbi:hypothetical protein O3Q51_10940 [Cryomorphaceae bacterium 1068]|nr:hypothetical protein [Cryomorphaceae bacterium 1068]